jgi:hypothetical protein
MAVATCGAGMSTAFGVAEGAVSAALNTKLKEIA